LSRRVAIGMFRLGGDLQEQVAKIAFIAAVIAALALVVNCGNALLTKASFDREVVDVRARSTAEALNIETGQLRSAVGDLTSSVATLETGRSVSEAEAKVRNENVDRQLERASRAVQLEAEIAQLRRRVASLRRGERPQTVIPSETVTPQNTFTPTLSTTPTVPAPAGVKQ
jgi:uncharacterized protein YhaN